MKKQLVKEAKRLQELAGIKEIKINDPNRNTNLKSFLDMLTNTMGLESNVLSGIKSWEELFKWWKEEGDLDYHTKEDIIDIAKRSNIPQKDIDYILSLPEVAELERG